MVNRLVLLTGVILADARSRKWSCIGRGLGRLLERRNKHFIGNSKSTSQYCVIRVVDTRGTRSDDEYTRQLAHYSTRCPGIIFIIFNGEEPTYLITTITVTSPAVVHLDLMKPFGQVYTKQEDQRNIKDRLGFFFR